MEKIKSRIASEDERFNSLLSFFFLSEEIKISIKAKHQSDLEAPEPSFKGSQRRYAVEYRRMNQSFTPGP